VSRRFVRPSHSPPSRYHPRRGLALTLTHAYHAARPSTRPRSHCVALSDAGAAFAWGRNDMGQLGVGDTRTRAGPTTVTGLKVPISSASTGKSHTVWVGSGGELFACGASKQGCCGPAANKKKETEMTPILVAGLPPVASVSAGGAFSLVIDRAGTLWAFGSSEGGVLGNGSDGAYNKAEGSIKMAYTVQATPTKIHKLADKTMVGCAAGPTHCAAIDDEGRCFTWGGGGYGRLGHREQKDLNVPTELVDIRATAVACGSLYTAALGYPVLRNGVVSSGGQATFYMWGRVRAASQNSWMYPQGEDDLRGWNLGTFACGAAHTVVAADSSVISWGPQCSCGELGYGEGEKKSSSRPKKCDDLEKMVVAQVACGLAHTVMLVDADDPVVAGLPEWTPVQVGISLYKILFHFKALLWESIILAPPPPATPTLLQFYCTPVAQYTLLPRPCVCMPYTIQYW